MKLLLKKDVSQLGYVGDVVEVSDGYARNYLLPQGLATEPTDSNMRALAEERKQAEERRRLLRDGQLAVAEKLREVEVTIASAANQDGVLYGSVGRREIAAALRDEGFTIEPTAILLTTPIRHLDNVAVEVKLADDIRAEIKVWVVRSKASEEELGEEEAERGSEEAGREAGDDDDTGPGTPG